jgi:hypothetical protein
MEKKMKKVISLISLIMLMFILVGCNALTKDDIMAAHLKNGSTIDLDPSMYIYLETLDTSFGNIDTTTEVNIISVYLYEYTAMELDSRYSYAYLIVEDKYALKNGASLTVDTSKYIIVYGEIDAIDSSNEILLIKNSISIFNDHRVTSGVEVPTFDLTEIILSSSF